MMLPRLGQRPDGRTLSHKRASENIAARLTSAFSSRREVDARVYANEPAGGCTATPTGGPLGSEFGGAWSLGRQRALLERQLEPLPNFHHRLGQGVNQCILVVRRGGNAQPLGPLRHGRIVDRLNVDGVLR